ncbi:MAG: Uma2 family endonuclease [Myxococcales bacterium]|nr:Uma2 family endonuclease [Myxococcales bacterium]
MSKPMAWEVDPKDPRAPPLEVWERMSPDERARVVDSLPSEFPPSESAPPEGDRHFNAKAGARDALGSFFARIGRHVYLACELPVYYPAEPMFAPDVIAVLDVELRERDKWVVAAEGKGLDFALEVHVAGDRRKDLERNTERFARLGIPEYFIFDRGRLRLTGFRLPPHGRVYQPILPQGGRYSSSVLGLDLMIDDSRLRFYHGTAPLPESNELIGRLEGMLSQVEARVRAAEERAEEEARGREEEARGREEEARGREEAERRLSMALAEIERLKRSR